MENIWLKSYPPNVPAQINPDAYQSIVEMFEKSCSEFADRPAFYNMGTTITYRELDKYSRYFAAYLQQQLNLKKGDRVAIMMPNLLQYPIALFAALRAGLIVVNINPLYTADELTHQLNDAKANTIISVENFASTIEKALPKTPTLKNIILSTIGEMLSPVKGAIVNLALKYVYKKIPTYNLPNAILFKHCLSKGKDSSLRTVNVNNNDIAFLQYTGGTTGVSKGAVLTHRNIIANIEQADAWFSSVIQSRDETIITALPLYHIFSLTANCLYFTKNGGLNILITNPRDISGMIKEMRKFKFTAITGVNTLFNGLLKNPDFANIDFSHLHLALGGGMAVQRVVAENWQRVTKAPLLEAYGLTETSPCVTINPVTIAGYNGTIGLPVPSTDICILDENRQELPLGEAGELAVKGPQVMREYWNNPQETHKVFTDDGWLLTGDVASVDEKGFVRLLERKKDMIVVSGFNVYPNEVEDIIARLKGIKEVAVVGISDSNSGEVPKAFIVKEDHKVTEEDVISFCRLHLTPYKVPKKIEFIDELPKTNVGKILRRALKPS